MQFSFGCLSENINKIVEDINNRKYVYGVSTAFVITYPTPREIYASQFRDRIIQHFFVEEIESCLNEILIPNTTSCRKHMGTSRALSVLKKQMTNLSQNGTKDCYFVKFLGKITYPYGYQKFTKETKARTIKQAREIIYDENLLSRLNSCIGRFYYYASYNLLQDYLNELPKEVWNYATYNQIKMKFEKGINYGYLRNSY